MKRLLQSCLILLSFVLYSQKTEEKSFITVDFSDEEMSTNESDSFISNKKLSSPNYSLDNTLEYCTPNFTACNDYIEKVIFATVNNDSECATGLNDYTDQIALVEKEESYLLSVRTRGGAAQYVYAFIDWNQNGVLDDSGEVYTIAANVHNNGPHVKEITIPENAELGQTRMRIIYQWNNNTVNPCITYNTGEAEDYTVHVFDEIPDMPSSCSQWVPSSMNFRSGIFGGDTNQRMAIDINVLPEASFQIDQVKIQTVNQASHFDLIFYEDVGGLPGALLHTIEDAEIILEEFLGSSSTFEFYRYTMEISSENILIEGLTSGKKVWLEVKSDAYGWNYSENSTLGSKGIFLNDDSDGWQFTDYEFVYEIIGTCEGTPTQEIPNNHCSDAIPIQCGAVVQGTTVGADDFGGFDSPDVFYSYTGNGTPQVVGLSFCAGTYFDTSIRIFTDCTLTNEIAFNDDFCGTQSAINFISDGVSTYYIMIEGGEIWNDDLGDFNMYVSCSDFPATNQNPSTAIPLQCGDVHIGTNKDTSNLVGDTSGDVFFSYKGNGVAEDITISLCHVFTTFDTVIRVYDNAGLTNEIAFNDDYCGKLSQLTFYSDGIRTYYIVIEGAGSEEGIFHLTLSCWDYTPYCSPVVFGHVEPITYVEVADIAHRSSASITSPPHEVLTHIEGNVSQGNAYEIALEGYTGTEEVGDGEWENFFTVFIDWNQNNVLNDPGEVYEIGSIFQSTGNDGQQAIGTITVPENALLGKTVMRVLKNYEFSSVDPCAWHWYGQVEDYTLNVSPNLEVEDFNKSTLVYYPNPVEDVLTIESDQTISKVTIYDFTGKAIHSVSFSSKQTQIGLSFLPSGTYIAEVLTLKGVQTIKFIKK